MKHAEVISLQDYQQENSLVSHFDNCVEDLSKAIENLIQRLREAKPLSLDVSFPTKRHF